MRGSADEREREEAEVIRVSSELGFHVERRPYGDEGLRELWIRPGEKDAPFGFYRPGPSGEPGKMAYVDNSGGKERNLHFMRGLARDMGLELYETMNHREPYGNRLVFRRGERVHIAPWEEGVCAHEIMLDD